MGCAQLLGTDDYEVDPSVFEDASGPTVDEPADGTDDTDGTETGTNDAPEAGVLPEPNTDTTDEADASGGEQPAPEEAGTTNPPQTGDASVGPGSDPDAGMIASPGTDGGSPGPAEDASTPPPDSCEPPPGGACELIAQCGCDTTEMCVIADATTGETGCIPEGSTAPYSPCVYDDECQAGYGCVSGVCKRHCDGDVASTCEFSPYSQCVQVTDGAADIPGYFVCLRACNPTAPEDSDAVYQPCGPGVNCLPSETGASFCIASDVPGQQDDPCETGSGEPDPYACAPGFACVTVGEESRCRQSCEVGASDCAAGHTCSAYGLPLAAADREIGYCQACPGVDVGECDVVSQCGCESGEMCAVLDFETGETGCMPEGSVPRGESCNVSVGECEPGTECLHWITTGICAAFCNDTSDCPNGTPCVEWEVPGVKMCLSGCNPADPASSSGAFNACAAGQSCGFWVEVPDSSVCIEPYVSAPEGAICYDEDTCGPGLTCVGVDSAGVCEPWCELGNDDCRTGERCVQHPFFLSQLATPLVVGGTPFGTCLAPQATGENTQVQSIPDFPEDAEPTDPPTPALSTVVISDAWLPVNHVEIEVNLQHTYVGDLDLVLTAPDGSSVLLFVGEGASLGQNMAGTVFTDDAPLAIADAVAPYSGQFRPAEALSAFAGLEANGEWTLQVADRWTEDVGSLESWRLTIY